MSETIIGSPVRLLVVIAIALGIAALAITVALRRRPSLRVVASALVGLVLGSVLTMVAGSLSGDVNRVEFSEQYVQRLSEDRTVVCLGDEPDDVADEGTCMVIAARDPVDGSRPTLRPGDRLLVGWVEVEPPAGSESSGTSYLVFAEPID